MDKKTQQELLSIVKNNYEEAAVDFDVSRQKDLWPELQVLAEMVEAGSRVLDIGCGNGRLLKAWADKPIKYIGLEPSQALLELARKNAAQIKDVKAEVKFESGNILELGNLPDLNFDYLFCVAVLHHLPGADLQIAALKQMKNKIKPEGRIVLTVWNMWPDKKLRRLIWKYFFLKVIGKSRMDIGDVIFDFKNSKKLAICRRYYHAFRMSEMKNIIKKAGLSIAKAYQDKNNYYFIIKK